MTPALLADLVRSFADDVLTRRGLDPAVLPATVAVRRPRDPRRGDYATNVALQTAPKAGVAPRQFAEWLAEALAASPAVHTAEVAGPGFVNLRLATGVRADIIRRILEAPPIADHPVPSDPAEAGASAELRTVQHAHARLAALARNAADLGISCQDAALELLEHEREVELIWMLSEFGRIAAADRPGRLLRYLTELAQHRHDFTDTCRMLPMGDEEPSPRHAARLALGEATRRVLADGLRLLGATAPERM